MRKKKIEKIAEIECMFIKCLHFFFVRFLDVIFVKKYDLGPKILLKIFCSFWHFLDPLFQTPFLKNKNFKKKTIWVKNNGKPLEKKNEKIAEFFLVGIYRCFSHNYFLKISFFKKKTPQKGA